MPIDLQFGDDGFCEERKTGTPSQRKNLQER